MRRAAAASAVFVGGESAGNFLVGDHVRKAIRAQQQAISVEQDLLIDVHFDLILSAQGAHQNVLKLLDSASWGVKWCPPKVFGDQRVIGGELFERAAAQEVGTAIADVRQAHAGDPNPAAKTDRGGIPSCAAFCEAFSKILRLASPDGAHQAVARKGPARLLPYSVLSGSLFAIAAMLDDRFHGDCAGDLRHSLPTIRREHVQVDFGIEAKASSLFLRRRPTSLRALASFGKEKLRLKSGLGWSRDAQARLTK